MRPTGPLVFLLGALVGYLHGTLANTPAPVEAQGRGTGGDQPQVTSTPPVPNPPLYPDSPNKPMHWSIDDLRKMHAGRVAAGKIVQGDFASQRFRTHNISTNSRWFHPQPIPSNITGVMSQWDDVEQHEGVSDFYVFVGGSGKMIVDGEIENREFRRARGNSGNSSVLLPGEFAGQPIRGGKSYEVKAGDWLAIPPNDPHWQNPAPSDPMTYLLLKVNIGLYPGSIAR